MQELQADVIDVLLPLEWPDCSGVYFVRAAQTQRVKIGVAGNIRRRLQALQTSSPHRLQLIGFVVGGTRENEKGLHRAFADLRTVGEWFTLSGALLGHIANLNLELSGRTADPIPPFSDEEAFQLALALGIGSGYESEECPWSFEDHWRVMPPQTRCDLLAEHFVGRLMKTRGIDASEMARGLKRHADAIVRVAEELAKRNG